jgi:hypothetical protein
VHSRIRADCPDVRKFNSRNARVSFARMLRRFNFNPRKAVSFAPMTSPTRKCADCNLAVRA